MARARRLLTAALAALSLGTGSAARAAELGHSGLHVERTPQSLLLTKLDANSPATLARVPSLDGRVVRVLYVNGEPALTLDQKGTLASAFRARTVMVTLGVRENDAAEERLEGPYVLDLIDSPQSRLKRLIASRQWLKVAALASSGQLRPEETEATWARVALEATQYARSEQWQQALELGDTIPPSDPAYRRVSTQLPTWRMVAKQDVREDRRVLAREVIHSGPNPRLVAARKKAEVASKKKSDRQGSRPRRNRDS